MLAYFCPYSNMYICTHYLLAQQLSLLPTPQRLIYSPWVHVFHFLNAHLSFPSVCVSICMCVSVCLCLSVCLCFDSQRQAFPENRSPDTEKQQVKAIFWCLLVAAGPRFWTSLDSYCKCGFVCVFLSNRGRGNQSGLVWSFVFIDKCIGQNRRAIEKFVFL